MSITQSSNGVAEIFSTGSSLGAVQRQPLTITAHNGLVRVRVPAGLRQRKKDNTRSSIRREAFRLIEAQGYAATTVDQIAAAAEVSPSTFYRYFGSKEAVLISSDHTEPVIDAFIRAPLDLTPVAAYRYATEEVFGALSTAARMEAIAGQRLLYTVPEARGLLHAEWMRIITLLTDALAHRPEAPADAAGRRVLAGAIVGAVMAASDNNPFPEVQALQALEMLERWMA